MCKRFIVLMLLVCFALSTTYVYAEHGMKKDPKGDLESKFYHKMMTVIKNQEELGLSDEQVKKLKDLKLTTKKEEIRKKAEIDMLAIDIKAGMWEDAIDINVVNALIDKKYELKKEKAKALVAAYVALKSVLTEEQQEKLKGLCKRGK